MKDKNQGCECSSLEYCDRCLAGMAVPTQQMLRELVEAAHDVPQEIGMTDQVAMDKYSRFLKASAPSRLLPVLAALKAPVPATDEQAYDMARQITQLVTEPHLGGITQLQAKIQCLIAGMLVPAPAPITSFAGATFFSYGTDSGYEEHQTAKRAKESAEADIDYYRGDACDGWSDEVAHIVWGVVLERSTQTDLRKRSDDDSCDPSIQEICDYELRPDFTPAPAPDWSLSERRDCTRCGSEGISTLHYNGEPVCHDCWPCEPLPATTVKPFKDVAPNDVVPVGEDWFRVRYITRHGDSTTLHLQREAEKLHPLKQNDVIHLSVENSVPLLIAVKARD